MAEFVDAFNHVMAIEKWELTNDPDDLGGQTYAGISRKNWPKWKGWKDVDAGRTPDSRKVVDFYRDGFWSAICGDDIVSQRIAISLFSFAVNAGTSTAIVLAQRASGSNGDGVVGRNTLAALNTIDPDLFLAKFALAKIARYRDICAKRPEQRKFIMGWINRTLKEAAL